MKYIESGITKAQLGTISPHINRIIKQAGVVNKIFVQALETLGYNIKITFLRRKE